MAFGWSEKQIRATMFTSPKVLLIRNPNEKDPWLDGVIKRVIDELKKRHIGYTSDIGNLEKVVNLSIVFINKEFLTNCSHILDHLLQHEWGRHKMASFVYENHDSPLVSDIIRAVRRNGYNYPNFFGGECSDDKEAECRRLDKLAAEFFTRALIRAKACPPDWDAIHKVIDHLVDYIEKAINPLILDFSKLCPHLLSYVTAFCTHLFIHFHDEDPFQCDNPHIVILEGCHDTSCGELSTISKLIFTFLKRMNRGEFSCCAYLSNSQCMDHDPRRSLYDAFLSASTNIYYPQTTSFFVLIDGLEDFLTKEDDPAIILARFAKRLGAGSLVISTSRTPIITTTIPGNTFIQRQTFGCGRGKECTTSLPNTTERKWPDCFTISDSRLLNALVLKEEYP